MTPFRTIGLLGKPHHAGALHTTEQLYRFLRQQGYPVLIERLLASQLQLPEKPNVAEVTDIGQQADLAIVVGGDGYMLGAARVLACHDIAVIGVNRGNLGFLTDLAPDAFEQPLTEVLNGHFKTEFRFLLQVEVHRHGQLKSANTAVNEAVLHHGQVARMMQFEVYSGGSFVYAQRSDGLIVSTPTGSTAYSLSGGGPILSPQLDAIALVPMFPHTLSSRPLVLDANDQLEIRISHENDENLQISCDGHVVLNVLPGDSIFINKAVNKLRLIHPQNHDYFHVLRKKLNWGSKLY